LDKVSGSELNSNRCTPSYVVVVVVSMMATGVQATREGANMVVCGCSLLRWGPVLDGPVGLESLLMQSLSKLLAFGKKISYVVILKVLLLCLLFYLVVL